jgi:hypothetical protein
MQQLPGCLTQNFCDQDQKQKVLKAKYSAWSCHLNIMRTTCNRNQPFLYTSQLDHSRPGRMCLSGMKGLKIDFQVDDFY